MSVDAFQCKCQWCLTLKTALLFVLLCVAYSGLFHTRVLFLLVESAGVIENVSISCSFFSQASLLKRQYCLTTSIMLWNRQQVWGCVWLRVTYLWESLSDFTQISFLNNVSFSFFFLFSWGGTIVLNFC